MKLSTDPVALGCMMMGTTMDEQTSFSVLDHFLGEGLSHLDTANCYAWWVGTGEHVGDESEACLGRWMKRRKNRNRLYLATKAGGRLKDPRSIRDASGIPRWGEVRANYEGASRSVLKGALEGSLRRLGTDRIDLYYVHVDDPHTPLEETLETLHGFVTQGFVGALGYSNVCAQRLVQIRDLCQTNQWTLPVAVQQEFSYLSPRPNLDRGIVHYADARIRSTLTPTQTLVAYSPLLKGLYTSEAKRQSVPLWAEYDHPESQEKLKVLGRVSQETGMEPNALVLAWILHQQPRVVPVLGFATQAQFRANLAAVENSGRLSEEVFRQMSGGHGGW